MKGADARKAIAPPVKASSSLEFVQFTDLRLDFLQFESVPEKSRQRLDEHKTI
jgi:hypothetical protein